jgi:hypothetical protein
MMTEAEKNKKPPGEKTQEALIFSSKTKEVFAD